MTCEAALCSLPHTSFYDLLMIDDDGHSFLGTYLACTVSFFVVVVFSCFFSVPRLVISSH